MKKIGIFDATLCREKSVYSFKEKLEIARQLERLNVDTIELPEINNAKTDILFTRTAASFVKNSVLSVAAGSSEESIENAILALNTCKNSCIRIELPLSPVGMEYTCRKKPDKMLEWIEKAVARAKQAVDNVEFCALDATRAEEEFLNKALSTAVSAGADRVAVCDSTGELLPDDFASFAGSISKNINVPVGVKCLDKNGLACAQAIMAVRAGADFVKTAVGGETVGLDTFADMVKNCGENYGFKTDVKITELHRIVHQINWITQNAKNEKSAATPAASDTSNMRLDVKDNEESVISAVKQLGYDLSDEDNAKVYEEFLRVAAKKNVGAKELDAIVASVALQVPATYKLVNYIINSGNIISASAQITLERDGTHIQGIQIGDGPVDAAFLAIESIIGHHYELDDFQIQSVTEGKEAMGSAIVKLRSNGKLYSGNGISTDILGASIRAFINAVNKIVFEEA